MKTHSEWLWLALCLAFVPGIKAQEWQLSSVGSTGAISMIDASTGWMAGSSGSIRRTNDGGATWQVVESGTTEHFTDIWAADATHVWAVTQSGSVRLWNGSTWSTHTSVPNYLYDVWGLSATDVWVVGTTGTVLRWNGSTWSTLSPGTSSNIYAVGGSDASNVWICGIGGFIRKWDGSSWAAQSSGTTQNLDGIWSADASNVWAVGNTGTIRKWDGSSWTTQASGTTQGLFEVRGISVNNAWAVGSNGTLLRWDGSSWAAQTSGTTNSLSSVSIVDATHVWVSGGAAILRWDGNTWNNQSSPVVGNLSAFWGTSGSDMIAVSSDFGGAGAKWNGSAWSAHTLGVFNGFYALWGSAADSVWAGGSGGAIRYWNGSAWTSQTSNTTQNLRAAWGADDANLWLAGAGGVIRKWNGSTWTTQASGSTQQLNGLWGIDTSNVWAVGNAGTLLKWNGSDWSPQTSGTAQNLNALWGVDASNIWAVGDSGTILKWNGSTWSPESPGNTGTLRAIWGMSTTQIWAVGDAGTILHWDGSAWTAEMASVPFAIHSIYGTGLDNLWAGGASGAIFKRAYAAAVPPTVDSASASNVTTNSATAGGEVLSDGGAAVTERGVVYSTSQNPTIEAGTKVVSGSGTGTFTADIVGLSATTTFYVRAYAVNSEGTGYGAQVHFTTEPPGIVLPTVTTNATGNVTTNSATSGGEVVADGGSAVIERGVVYSTSADPTTATGSKSVAGSGTGAFSSNLEGLSAGMNYHVRAYAINIAGTSYGATRIFTTDTIAAFGVDGTYLLAGRTIPGQGTQRIHFELGDPRIVAISLQSASVLAVQIYDAEGNLAGVLSEGGFEAPLLSGAYRLEISNGGTEAADYTLSIDLSVVARAQPQVSVSRRSLVSLRLRTVAANASVSNVGNLPDTLRITATRPTRDFRVAYTSGGNVTAQVTGGGLTAGPLGFNSPPAVIRATVTPNRRTLLRRGQALRRTFVMRIGAVSTAPYATSHFAQVRVQTR